MRLEHIDSLAPRYKRWVSISSTWKLEILKKKIPLFTATGSGLMWIEKNGRQEIKAFIYKTL